VVINELIWMLLRGKPSSSY